MTQFTWLLETYGFAGLLLQVALLLGIDPVLHGCRARFARGTAARTGSTLALIALEAVVRSLYVVVCVHFARTHGRTALLLGIAFFHGLDSLLNWFRAQQWLRVQTPLAVGCALLAGGSLSLDLEWGAWLAGGSLAVFVVLVLVLIWTTRWSARLGWVVAVGLVAGVGGMLHEAGPWLMLRLLTALTSTTFLRPWWLLLLLVLPVLFVISSRNLGVAYLSREQRRGLVTVLALFLFSPRVALDRWEPLLGTLLQRVPNLERRWFSFGLRAALVIFLALALSEPLIPEPAEGLTVIFVLDRSLSVPEETEVPHGPDLRWERVRRFLNNSVATRPRGHERDRAGLVVFGKRPRLELLPTDAPRFNLTEITSPIDGQYTDIAAALQLALAVFPEGSSKRIVLISDGNENLGNAEEVANLARANGVQIDVVPLAADRNRNEDINEVLVERVEAPTQIEVGTQVPIRVWVRSFSSRRIAGTLKVRQITESQTTLIQDPPPEVILEQGLNSFTFKQPLGAQQESYTYEAEFEPLGIVNEQGKVVVKGLPGDRVQNNRATTHVVARGRRRILVLEAKAGEHSFLVEKLRAAGQAKFKVETRPIDYLSRFPDRDTLSTYLSNFDCVVLANVPADMVSEDQREILRSNTHDQGCGLVMIGGPQAYGAGGWQQTAVEKALPVDADIKSLEVEGKGGLVLIMHASEMANGNAWQKKIAKLAIERLAQTDEVGVLYWDMQTRWQIPLQEVGEDRGRLYRLVDRLSPGDMPDFDPSLLTAHKSLMEPARNLTARHVIIISDGDPAQNNKGILATMRRDKVTVSTVGVATHGPALDAAMKGIARATGGRSYFPRNPSELPSIYIKETRLVSQSFVYKKLFQPQLLFRAGPTAGLPQQLPPLKGFVRTTPKTSPLVEIPIRSPSIAGQNFPLLAYWPYGLGKAVAFTSDAGQPELWCADWASDPVYARFWEQVMDWCLRPVESRYLAMTTDYRDGRIKVVVEARTEQGAPDLYLQEVRAEVTPPRVGPDSPRKPEIRFEQKAPGLYEAECKAEEAGSYFIAFQANRRVLRDGKMVLERESVRGSVTIPYAPEFADMKSNPDLLEKLRELTQGESYADNDSALATAAKQGTVFREGLPGYQSLQPVWYWLIFLTATLLLFDVAIRRIALERLELVQQARRVWGYLRHRQVEIGTEPEFLQRLKSRKAQVEETLSKPKASRKFEAPEVELPAPPGAAAPPSAPTQAPSPPPKAPPPVAPPPGPEAGDYASRLLRAKKKVWEERKDEGK